MTFARNVSLRAQIAGLSLLVAVGASVAAETLPHLVFVARNHLFELSLASPDRARIAALTAKEGFWSVHTQAELDSLGFDGWRMCFGWVLAGVVAATALGMAFLARCVAGRLAAPIERLALAARAVASGERRLPPARPATSAELAALQDDFAAMTAALSAAEADLRLRSQALAHDIRTPLAVLRGRIVGAQEGIFPADHAFFDGLLRHVGMIDELVADLNALADANQAMAGSRERVWLDEVAAEAVERFRPEFAAAGASVDMRVHARASVLADPAKLTRAVVNLLRNALCHAPGAAVVVTVWREGGTAAVRVADQGPGWPAGDPRAMARPFVRGEGSRCRETGGSGLGLAIADAIARAYGGRLLLARAVPHGAVAELRLACGCPP